MRFLPLFAAIFAITPLAIDLYLPALPRLADSLGTNIQVMQNSLSLYLMGYAFGMFVFGPMADRFGRRPLLLSGLSGFVLFSWLLSQTESSEMFLVLRFLQAFAGGAATVVIPGAIKQLFGKDTAKGLSYVSMIMMVAPMVAPALGSYLLLVGEWTLIFQLLSVYALLMLIIAALFFPKLERSQQTNQQQSISKNESIVKLTFVSSYKKVLSRKSIHSYLATSMLASLIFFTYITAVPFLYIQVFGLSEMTFSLLFGLNVVGLLVANFINTRLVPRFGSKVILYAAAKIAFILLSGLVLTVVFGLTYQWVVALLIPAIATMMLISVNSDALILQQFSQLGGTATAVIGTLRFGCGALAGPLLAVLFDASALPVVMIMFVSIALLNLGLMTLSREGYSKQDIEGFEQLVETIK